MLVCSFGELTASCLGLGGAKQPCLPRLPAFCRTFAVGCLRGTHHLDDALSFAGLPYRSHSLSRLMHRHGFWCCIAALLQGARHLRVYVSLCIHIN